MRHRGTPDGLRVSLAGLLALVTLLCVYFAIAFYRLDLLFFVLPVSFSVVAIVIVRFRLKASPREAVVWALIAGTLGPCFALLILGTLVAVARAVTDSAAWSEFTGRVLASAYPTMGAAVVGSLASLIVIGMYILAATSGKAGRGGRGRK